MNNDVDFINGMLKQALICSRKVDMHRFNDPLVEVELISLLKNVYRVLESIRNEY